MTLVCSSIQYSGTVHGYINNVSSPMTLVRSTSSIQFSGIVNGYIKTLVRSSIQYSGTVNDYIGSFRL